MNLLKKLARIKVEHKFYFIEALILIALSIAFLCEIFYFNRFYFTIPSLEKKDYQISKEDLILNDIYIDETGNFVISGENPYFKIPENRKVYYLIIEPTQSSEVFTITPSKEGKLYVYSPPKYPINDGNESVSYLRVNASSQNVVFKINSGSENIIGKSFGIDKITIDNIFVFNWYRLFAVFSLISVVFYFVFYKKVVSKKLEITFLVLILFFGANIAILKPTYHSFDEKDHFIKAYRLGSFDPGISGEKKILWPENIENFFSRTAPFNSIKEKESYEYEFSSVDYSNLKHYSSTADNYLPIAYLPAALGIFVGKLLNFPFLYVFYMGRIFSVFTYALMLYLVIKNSKYAKKTIFMLSLLPGTVYLASSYSADGILFASSLAVVSIFLNMMASKEKINRKDFILFFLSILIMMSCKFTYIFLALLIFVIPSEKFGIQKKLKIFLLKTVPFLASLCVMAFNLYYASYIVTPAPIEEVSTTLSWTVNGVDEAAQLMFILHNLPQYILICFKFVTESFMLYFIHPIGAYGYIPDMPLYYAIVILMLVLFVTVVDNESSVLKINIKNKILLATVIILSWGLVISTLYLSFNAVGSVNIRGVQGRYFAPLLLPFLLLFKNTKIFNNFNEEGFNQVISIGTAVVMFSLVYELLILYNF